jgi:hypothetical protein
VTGKEGREMKVSRRAGAGAVDAGCALVALLVASNIMLPFPAALSADSTAREAALASRAMSLQTRVFGKAPANQSFMDRLVALEIYLLGKAQAGDPHQRLTNLQEILDGKPRPSAKPNVDLPPVNDNLFDATKSADPVATPMPKATGETERNGDTEGKTTPWRPAETEGKAEHWRNADSSSNVETEGKAEHWRNADSSSNVETEGKAQPLRKAQAERKPQAEHKASASSATNPESFLQSVKNLEERVFGHATVGSDAEASLVKLETFAIGKPQTGTLERRLARLEGILNGTAPVEQSGSAQ